MERTFDQSKNWALILGGSSGMGLASAKKLASMGLNIFIVHRDRRGAMKSIQNEFDAIKEQGVCLETFNGNALSSDGMQTILNEVQEKVGNGKIRLLLHSIALGNLKLLAPYQPESSTGVAQLAESLGLDSKMIQEKIDHLFEGGAADLVQLATPAAYDSSNLNNDEDFNETIYNMGTNLSSWVRSVFERQLFAQDARVLGLTSEGNEVAWRGYAAVAAAKSALESVSRAIAREYAAFGLRCNILQPGITETPALRRIPGHLHMMANAIQRNPFRRLTSPEDVANVVALMTLDESSWINGSIIRVDGGEHISG